VKLFGRGDEATLTYNGAEFVESVRGHPCIPDDELYGSFAERRRIPSWSGARITGLLKSEQ
jgi:hypothetical protein